MSLVLLKARTAVALGLLNVWRATSYRLALKLGVHPVQRLTAAAPDGPFFVPCALPVPAAVAPADRWLTQGLLFGRWPLELGDQPPHWLLDPLTGNTLESPLQPWWRIPDFDPRLGDIKGVWELSRFDWVVVLAQHVREQRPGAAARLESWLADWCKTNPPYLGPNWKCGQEGSIRVLHLATAALVLGQENNPISALCDMVRLHLQRIAPTLPYAVSQDNNHGTSEAAALFIGGHWLAHAGDPNGRRWAALGLHWLEERAGRLIGNDGSFSQYSVNYHRMMLDAFSLVECWRVRLDLPPLSDAWQAKARLATRWLWRLVDSGHGDAPNTGANDGARLLPLSGAAYRDYRPSVQLAAALFEGARAFEPNGVWDEPFAWLGLAAAAPTGHSSPPRQSDVGGDGGFGVLIDEGALALLRYPRYRFRPSQSDALHLDFWLDGENLLRDGGTYSYNKGEQWLRYFSGVESHNTIQFDGRDQMPRLGRFLFGRWLRTSLLEPPSTGEAWCTLGAGYADAWGASHTRRLRLSGRERLIVADDVRGFSRTAVLRWRLAPGDWTLNVENNRCQLRRTEGRPVMITVEAGCGLARAALVSGWESPHYLERVPLPVLELEVTTATTFTTEIEWAA